jgi:glutaminyl-peptide cyclotransferase
MKSSFPLYLLALLLGFQSCKQNTQAQASPTPPKLELASADDAQAIAIDAYKHTKAILNFGHRQPESPGLRKSKDYVISELKKAGWHTLEQSFEAKTPNGTLTFSNLIARYDPEQSRAAWGRPVQGVLAAHIDSKILPNFLGADDAASCVATLIALAKHLDKHHPDVARHLELVCFDGEESIGPNMVYGRDGLYGSIHYSRSVQQSVASRTSPHKKVPKFGILLDMIGHRNLSIKIPSDTPKKLKASYQLARKKYQLEKHFNFADGPILDDHVPMNEIANIPTLDLIGDFASSAWWHTPQDNLSLISPDSLKMSVLICLEIVADQIHP